MVRAFPDLYEMYSDGYFFFSDCREVVEPKATGRRYRSQVLDVC